MRIGGSDWTDVLGLEPYGCSRRAFYRKRGVEPDYPEQVTGPMRRGEALEPVVAEEWRRRSGRVVVKDQGARELAGKRSTPLPDWWQGRPDYQILPADAGDHVGVPFNGPGVLECKTTNPIAFRKDRRQARPDHVAQVQTYLSWRVKAWGVIFILEPVSFDVAEHVVIHNPDLEAEMIEVGNEFVAKVAEGTIPPKLEASDSRCQKCAFRISCQGEALYADEDWTTDQFETENEVLHELAREYLDLSEIEAEAEEAKAQARSRIIAALGGERMPSKKVILPAGPRICWTRTTQTRVDIKALKADHKDLVKPYLRTTSIGQLRVYP